LFKDQIECYKTIFEDLERSTPTNWQKIKIEFEYTSNESAHGTFTYWDQESSEVTYAGGTFTAIYIDQLAHLVSNEEKGLFKKCTLEFFKDGKYDASFEYT
jgi:hypothetical protein